MRWGEVWQAWFPGKELELMGGDKCNEGTEPGGKTFGVGAGPEYNGNVVLMCEKYTRELA